MAFGSVVKQLLVDVQQRLVFRAQVSQINKQTNKQVNKQPRILSSVVPKLFIQSDIHGYNPSPGDLTYPDKLVVAVS